MKLKTNKSISERIKITGSGKFLHRPVNQSHFNAKDSGKTGRAKHGNRSVEKADVKSFKQYLPYN